MSVVDAVAGLIHVGAHDGHEYLESSRPMVLIEPQGGVFDRLRRNFDARDDVTLINVAVGAAAGTAVMHVAANDESSSLLEPALHLEMYPDTPFTAGETVMVDTLDHVMAAVAGEFDELVVDVQGYELEVLRGATVTLGKVRKVTCEVNTAEMFKGCALLGDVDALLAGAGFERTGIDLYGEVWGDAIYERRG